jgi:hypothetical protein
MTAAIEVLEGRRFDGHGNLKAFAKVKIGCIVIDSCRIVQRQPAPQKARGTGWCPVVEITSRSGLDQLRRAILDAGARGPDRSPRCEQPTRAQAIWDGSRDRGHEP